MSNSVALVMFLVIILLSVGGFVFMFTQTAKIPVKTITCVDEWDSSISVLIDEENRALIMNGEEIKSEKVTTFNETAIAAKWRNGKIGTRLFLDRVAAKLEIETTRDLFEWDKVEFTCKKSNIRF